MPLINYFVPTTDSPTRSATRSKTACAARPGADHRSGWRGYAEILDLDARIRLPPDYGADEKRRDIWLEEFFLATERSKRRR